jgi:hypothetical protein
MHDPLWKTLLPLAIGVGIALATIRVLEPHILNLAERLRLETEPTDCGWVCEPRNDDASTSKLIFEVLRCESVGMRSKTCPRICTCGGEAP